RRVGPPRRVLEEERLLPAGDEVGARDRARHRIRRSIPAARRGAEDRAVDIRVPEAQGEGELATRRDAQDPRTGGPQPYAEAFPHPPAHVLDEEPLVGGEALGVEAR